MTTERAAFAGRLAEGRRASASTKPPTSPIATPPRTRTRRP